LIEFRDVAIELRRRRVRNQRRHPLDGFSARVDDGEVVALVGERGFGGTTIARLAAGVVAPDSGVIMVDDLDITNMPAKRRPVGLIPAGGGLLPQLTAEDNITYGLRLRGVPDTDISDKLAATTERLELERSLQLRPHELSAGQRLRVALARALVRSVPIRVLSVDATAGSESLAEGLTELRDIIKLAPSNTAMPILLCTRDRAVFSQADRVVVVINGRAGPNGPPEQLMAEPPDLATAHILLQPMADIPGVVRDGYIDIDCGAFRPPAPAEIRQDRDVRVVLTEDNVDLVGYGHGLPAKIVAVDQTGATVYVLVEPAVRPGIRCPVAWTSSRPPRVGNRVEIRITAERLLVFDSGVAGHPRLAPRADG
jgi:putative spermidine/putrescine transport system ATP-binding protein